MGHDERTQPAHPTARDVSTRDVNTPDQSRQVAAWKAARLVLYSAVAGLAAAVPLCLLIAIWSGDTRFYGTAAVAAASAFVLALAVSFANDTARKRGLM